MRGTQVCQPRQRSFVSRDGLQRRAIMWMGVFGQWQRCVERVSVPAMHPSVKAVQPMCAHVLYGDEDGRDPRFDNKLQRRARIMFVVQYTKSGQRLLGSTLFAGVCYWWGCGSLVVSM